MSGALRNGGTTVGVQTSTSVYRRMELWAERARDSSTKKSIKEGSLATSGLQAEAQADNSAVGKGPSYPNLLEQNGLSMGYMCV
jgi:hypothetical protein